MASFQDKNGHPVTSVLMTVGHVRRLKAVGGTTDPKPLALRTSDPSVAGFQGPQPNTLPNTTAFVLQAKKAGTAILALAVTPSLPAPKPGAPTLTVTVIPALVLPNAATDEGAVARLLLAENKSPWWGGYDAASSLKSMQWMRLVLENRLANQPKRFSAAGATNLRAIIAAKPEQFHGFSGYPSLPDGITKNINDALHIANDDNHPKQEQFIGFVANAISVANRQSTVTDPSPRGLYGWRTTGHGAPGDNFKEYQNTGGNTFYTLGAT